MKFRANKMLGLALGERSILIAEVTNVTGRCQVAKAAEFIYPDGVSQQQPEALGNALRHFIKEQGFSARAAVFGIPAKSVLTKSKELPPVDPTLTADLLRLQVESEFSTEFKDLVYDYAGTSNPAEPSHVLLAATPKSQVEQAVSIAQEARLELAAIVPTSVALTAATTRNASDALVLSITPSATELSAQRGNQPSLLRHIGASSATGATVAGEVRRASLMIPRNGSAAGNGSANGSSHGSVIVWDDARLDPTARAAITAALGPAARTGNFSDLGAGDLPSGVDACAAAVSLAMAGLNEDDLAIDFLHPRLAEPKKAALKRQTALAIAAGVIVIIGAIYAYADLQSKEKTLAGLVADNKAISEDRKKAESEVAMIKYAQGWHADKPRYLSCLRDLTTAIPDDGQMYLISFNLHDSMKGDIGGKATTREAVLTLVRRLNESKHFSDVKMSLDLRDIRHVHEVTFTINFKYVPA